MLGYNINEDEWNKIMMETILNARKLSGGMRKGIYKYFFLFF